jgi:hypothetical protein
LALPAGEKCGCAGFLQAQIDRLGPSGIGACSWVHTTARAWRRTAPDKQRFFPPHATQGAKESLLGTETTLNELLKGFVVRPSEAASGESVSNDRALW